MPSLLVLAWMSVVSAVMHEAHHQGRAELASFAVLQALCFAAGAMEAGALEQGAPVRGSRQARIAAGAAGAWYLGLVIYLGWTASP
jgi:hypothetical protein